MARATWKKATLKSLCHRIGDGLHGTPEYSDSDIYFINGNNLENGAIKITENTKTVSEVELEKHHIPLNENTLLISINGTLGELGFYNGEKVMLGKSAAYLNFKSPINRFYFYYFQLPEIQKYFWNVATGSTIKNLSLKSLQDFEVPVPEELEWKQISSILSSLDSKVELNNRINAELEAMAKTIYDYWFVQFDFPISAAYAASVGQPELEGRPYRSSGGEMVWNEQLKRELPKGWDSIPLGDLIDLNYGKALKTDKRSGSGFPVVGSSGIVGYHDTPLVDGPGISVGRKGTVGKVTFLFESFYPIDTAYFVTPKCNIGMTFMLHLLKSIGLETMNSDSAVPGLNRSRALSINIPSFPVELIQTFESHVDSFFKLIDFHNRQNQELALLRDWLLPMLMNGQVKVTSAKASATKVGETLQEGEMGMAAEEKAEYHSQKDGSE